MYYTLADIDLSSISAERLGEILIEAKKSYYASGKPIMDDATYDTLEDHLKQIHPHHRIFQKIGTPSFDTGFNKVSHIFPMTSQNKVKSYSELEKYFSRHHLDKPEFVVQPKLDGLSLELIYENGNFLQALTRGDGHIGDDISQNVIKMKNFCSSIPDFNGSLRAEIMVTYDDFSKLDQNNYTNPRNAASGISQRLDGLFSNLCTLIYHDLYPTNSTQFNTESEKISFLNQHGLASVETKKVSNLMQIEDIFQHYATSLRQTLEFDIDGLVVKIDDLKLSDSLGLENARPKGQVAYKFPAKSSQTKILDVVWQVGPLGTLTPVAKVEPVEVSGAVISLASLANYDLIQTKNINLGDYVEISRRGDVIPLIEKVVNKITPGHLQAPTVCPSCQTDLITDHKFLKCPNPNCTSQLLGRLRLYCQFLDIQNISEKTIEKLFKQNKLKNPADFYDLSLSDIANIDGLGEKSASKIIDQIGQKKELSLVDLFTAVAIPSFSKKRIQQLVGSGFDTPQKILDLDIQTLEKQPGFQSGLAKKVYQGLQQRQSVINQLLRKTKLKHTNLQNILHGSNFCITGTLSEPRKNIEDLIVQKGGKVASSVTKNTAYLVTNDQDTASSKLNQAKRLGIKIISEPQLRQLLK